MRIAVDASVQCLPHPTGVERSQRTWLAALLTTDADLELVVLAPGALSAELAARLAGDARVTLVCGDGRVPMTPWRQRVLPGELARRGVALLHAPVAALPRRLACPAVATVHELSRWRHDGWRHARHAAAVRAAAHRAWRLLCVSERTRAALVARHPTCAPRTRVVPHGVDPRFAQPASGTRREALARLGIADAPYALAVGRLRRKKNLARLLHAFAAAAPASHRLLLVGPDGDAAGSLRRAADDVAAGGRVHVTGYLDDALLAELMRHAACLVHGAHSEGFGLPVVEAMAAGTPVVASREGAVREATGAAVEPFDACDGDSLAAALRAVLGDPARAAALVTAGRAHAARLGADRCARAIVALWSELQAPAGAPAALEPAAGSRAAQEQRAGAPPP